MKSENFLSFSVVSGFFIGLAIALFKFDDPIIIVFFTGFTIVSLYIITMFSISVFLYFIEFRSIKINKEVLENKLDEIGVEFDKKERETAIIRNYIKSVDFAEILENKPDKNKNTNY